MNNRKTSNNFIIIRLVAAFFVLAGHMGAILGTAVPLVFGMQVQAVGAKMLFLLGGYFIGKSWESDKNVLRYALKRVSRIWPPMIVAILFAALVVGPVFTTLPVKTYLLHEGTWFYVVRNILFFPIYYLPGVFESNIYPVAVNGSLWTMPVELFMYIMVPIIATIYFGRKTKKNFVMMSIFVSVVCIFQIIHLACFPGAVHVFYGTEIFSMLDLIPFYLIGMLFTFPQIKKILNVKIAVAAFAVCMALSLGVVFEYIMLFTAFPYIVFSFGMAEDIKMSKKLSGAIDISYGIYLFGFMIQQSLVAVSIKLGFSLTFGSALLISAVLTVILAYLSHRFIELPIMNLSRKLIGKIGKKKANA